MKISPQPNTPQPRLTLQGYLDEHAPLHEGQLVDLLTQCVEALAHTDAAEHMDSGVPAEDPMDGLSAQAALMDWEVTVNGAGETVITATTTAESPPSRQERQTKRSRRHESSSEESSTEQPPSQLLQQLTQVALAALEMEDSSELRTAADLSTEFKCFIDELGKLDSEGMTPAALLTKLTEQLDACPHRSPMNHPSCQADNAAWAFESAESPGETARLLLPITSQTQDRSARDDSITGALRKAAGGSGAGVNSDAEPRNAAARLRRAVSANHGGSRRQRDRDRDSKRPRVPVVGIAAGGAILLVAVIWIGLMRVNVNQPIAAPTDPEPATTSAQKPADSTNSPAVDAQSQPEITERQTGDTPGGAPEAATAGSEVHETRTTSGNDPALAFAALSEQRAQALHDGDAEALSQLTMPDSPAQKADATADFAALAGKDILIETSEASVTQHTAETAQIAVRVLTRVSADGDVLLEETGAVAVELRLYQGQWRVYSVAEEDG